MPRYYKDKEIKKCADCPLMVKEEEEIPDYSTGKVHKCEILYCPPIKEKYGWNIVEGNWKPGREFCRLTNEVSLDFILESGQFVGYTIREVLKTAPKYISELITRGLFVIK